MTQSNWWSPCYVPNPIRMDFQLWFFHPLVTAFPPYLHQIIATARHETLDLSIKKQVHLLPIFDFHLTSLTAKFILTTYRSFWLFLVVKRRLWSDRRAPANSVTPYRMCVWYFLRLPCIRFTLVCEDWYGTVAASTSQHQPIFRWSKLYRIHAGIMVRIFIILPPFTLLSLPYDHSGNISLHIQHSNEACLPSIVRARCQ